MVAKEFGQDPFELMNGKWSVSQRKDAAYWLSLQWNNPSRTDHYIMVLTDAVRNVLSRRARKIDLKKLKLRFDSGETQQTELTPEEFDDLAMAFWLGVVGG